MPPSYFDRNQNLQINGDVTFVSSGGSTHDDPSFFKVSQRVQATNAQARVIERGASFSDLMPILRLNEVVSGSQLSRIQITLREYFSFNAIWIRWLDDPDGQIAMWMSGPVGIGKSAIAQTVAHQAAERGQLSSAFFFFRSDNSRNTAERLVPTLAYEMTQQMPHTLDLVCQTIGANPLLFAAPLDLQIGSAVLHPLSSRFHSSPRRHMLIIIDGLDECLGTKTQQAIIRSFIVNFHRMAEETMPHKILIVSRPESHIASAVSAADIKPHVKYLALESWKTADDIGIFLRSKLTEIQQTHPLRHYLPGGWPSDALFRELRQRSVGSFAYASVAIHYLASHDNNPEHALKDLLSLQPNRAALAFADLDALYRHILLSLDAEMRFILQKVLCLYVYSSCPNIKVLAARLLEDTSVVKLALLRVSSLLQIETGEYCQYIGFHHTSFEDFLCDKERSSDLYVFSPNVASAVAQALSSLWLFPISDVTEYQWFDYISTVKADRYLLGIPGREIGLEMYVHVINTLVATKMPSSFLHPLARTWESSEEFSLACKPVTMFITFLLKQRDELNSDSTHRALFNNAYNVICTWLRSHFNLFCQNAPTPNDVLDILLKVWHNKRGIAREKFPFLRILYDVRERELSNCIMRVFSDINRGEIFSRILERYLELPSNIRNKFPKQNDGLTVPRLYTQVLNRGGRIPSFCQKLEQIILMGQRSFGGVPSLYVTPRDYIFRFFYGDQCYLDTEYQMAVENKKVSDICKAFRGGSYLVNHVFTVASKTDRYIRQAHREHEFAYISEDIENLYRTASPMFVEDWWRGGSGMLLN
ncbi:hypothetical protein D9619_005119 [Psilocybe cf. subviscida]|uniref:Nephrocystin 3-like N-terminal domain-containing protein n=1 Tax=Psilocybe cf. subviscida TaxID=2480587 RepID=A0A8H5BQ15_9AGAR|nr:hypothetical protein D9619_005119 [Psilocybe cf. subviscida]